MSRFCLCNCPAGFSAAPERHAPDCPGRSGAGKPRISQPVTVKIETSIAELQATIARLTAENDRLKGGQGEAVALLGKGFTTLESCDGSYKIITAYQNRDDAWSDYKALCRASRPAPLSVVLPERQDPSRTVPLVHPAHTWNACLDKIKELNQCHTY